MSPRTQLPYPGLRPFQSDETDIFFGREEQVNQMIEDLGDQRFIAVVGTSGCGKSSLVKTGLIPGLLAGFLADAGPRWKIAEMRPGGAPLLRLAEALTDQQALWQELVGTEIDRRKKQGASRIDEKKISSEILRMIGATLRRGPNALQEILAGVPLNEAKTNLLLVIDQFEEIFRYRKEGSVDEAEAFVEILLASARNRSAPVYVAITMRSDFIGDCALFPGLPQALNEGQFLVPRLSREQRREAIEMPAKVFGGLVEPSVLNRLLNDMELNRHQAEKTAEGGPVPDQLPLMQHALMRMWLEARKVAEAGSSDNASPRSPETSLTINLDTYRRVGGLNSALSQHADETLKSLDTRDQKIAEVMFRLLTERVSGVRDRRRPTKLGAIAKVAGVRPREIAKVAETFRRSDRSFLTPPAPTPLTSDTVLDITHESLITQWPRLDRWADEEAKAVEEGRELEIRAARWDQQGRTAGHLAEIDLRSATEWQKSKIHNAEWAKLHDVDYPLAADFIKASQRREKQLRRERETQQEKELRLERKAKVRSWWATTVSVIALLAAVVGFIIQFQAKTKAEEDLNRIRAQTHLSLIHAARSRSGLQDSERNEDTPLSLLLYMKALAKKPSRQLLGELGQLLASRQYLTLGEHSALSGPSVGHEESVRVAAYRPDGKLIATGGDDDKIFLWDARTGAPRGPPLKGHLSNVALLAFSPDGSRLASADLRGRMIVWNTKDADNVTQIAAATISQGARQRSVGRTLGIAFAGDNRTLLIGGAASGVLKWNTERKFNRRPQYRSVLSGIYQRTVQGIALHPSKNMLASLHADGSVVFWDLDARVRVHTLQTPHRPGRAIAYSPDGSLLAWGSTDGRIFVWDSKKDKVASLRGHEGIVWDVAFDSNGASLASAGADKSIILWDVGSGQQRFRKKTQETPYALSFASAGKVLFVGHRSGKLTRWDPRDGALLARDQILSSQISILSLALSPDGKSLAIGASDGMMRLRDVKAVGSAAISFSGRSRSIIKIAFHPNGGLIASAGSNGMIRFWNIERKSLVAAPIVANTGAFFALGFSRLTNRLVSGGRDGRIFLWDTSVAPAAGVWLDRPYSKVAFSRNGGSALFVHQDGTMLFWDSQTDRYERVGRLATVGSVVSLTMSDKGRYVATATQDNVIRVLEIVQSGPTKRANQIWIDRSEDRVSALRFGRKAVLAGVLNRESDSTIILWQPTKGGWELKHEIPVDYGQVRALVFSPDGTSLFSASDREKAKDPAELMVWDVENGRPKVGPMRHRLGSETWVTFSHGDNGILIRKKSGHETLSIGGAQGFKRWRVPGGAVRDIAIIPKSREAVTAGNDKIVRIWSAVTGPQRNAALGGHTQYVKAVAVSHDSRYLATGGYDGRVFLRMIGSEKSPETLVSGSSRIHDLAFSPRNNLLAIASSANDIVLVDTDSSERSSKTLLGHRRGVLSLAFSPDGNTLASGSSDTKVILWDLSGAQPVRKKILPGHTGAIIGLRFSPDGKILASAGYDSTIRVWDAKTGQYLYKLTTREKATIYSIDFDPATGQLVSGHGDGTIRRWDLARQEVIGSAIRLHQSAVLSIAFSNDGNFVVSSDNDGTVKVHDRSALKRVYDHYKGVNVALDPILAVSPSGAIARVRFGRKNEIAIFRQVAQRRKLMHKISLEKVHPVSAAFGPERTAMFAVGGLDGKVVVWNGGRRLFIKTGHKGSVKSLAFSSDGTLLASGGIDSLIKIWGLPNGKLIRTLPGHGAMVTTLAFGGRRKTLASGSFDGTVKVWDLSKDSSTAQVSLRHGSPITALVFGPRGKKIAAADLYGSIGLWAVASTTSPLTRLEGHSEPIRSLAFSRDGKMLASAGLDDRVVIWDVDEDSWKRKACQHGKSAMEKLKELWPKIVADEKFKVSCS